MMEPLLLLLSCQIHILDRFWALSSIITPQNPLSNIFTHYLTTFPQSCPTIKMSIKLNFQKLLTMEHTTTSENGRHSLTTNFVNGIFWNILKVLSLNLLLSPPFTVPLPIVEFQMMATWPHFTSQAMKMKMNRLLQTSPLGWLAIILYIFRLNYYGCPPHTHFTLYNVANMPKKHGRAYTQSTNPKTPFVWQQSNDKLWPTFANLTWVSPNGSLTCSASTTPFVTLTIKSWVIKLCPHYTWPHATRRGLAKFHNKSLN